MMKYLKHDFEQESENLSAKYNIGNLENQFYLEIILARINDYSQLNFWDKGIANKVYTMMNTLGGNSGISNLTSGFQYLVLSIEELFSSATAFSLLQKYDGPQEVKVTTLLLPDIAQLVNGPFTNLLKFLMYSLQTWLDSNGIDKDVLSQNSNKSMMQVLNKYYKVDVFSNIINGNIRNALSHGGYRVINGGSYVTFYYSEGNQPHSLNVVGSVLNDDSYKTLDVVSGAIIGVLRYFVSVGETEKLFSEDFPIVYDFENRLKLSTNQFNCVYAGKNLDYDDLIEVRVESKENVSQDTISTWAINFLAKARSMFPDAHRYMFNFGMPNAINSWGQILGTTLDHYLEGRIDAQGVLEQVVSEEEDKEVFVQFPVNNDLESGVRLLFNPYEPIRLDGIIIGYIRDMSIKDAKRFACRAFVDSKTVRGTKAIMDEVIKSVSKLPNYSKPEYKVKYGSMNADVVLVDVYRKNRATRHDSAFVKSSENSNYIGSCEYYGNGFRNRSTDLFDTLDWQNLRSQNGANKLWLWNKNIPRK